MSATRVWICSAVKSGSRLGLLNSDIATADEDKAGLLCFYPLKKTSAGSAARAVCAAPPWCDILCALHARGQMEGVHGSFMPDERPTESTRDRVRALVRAVLANAAPAEEEGAGARPAPDPRPPAGAGGPPLARVVNVAPAEAEKPAAAEKDYERDESSKGVITEDD